MAHIIYKNVLGAIKKKFQSTRFLSHVVPKRNLSLSQGRNAPEISNVKDQNPISDKSRKIYELRTYQIRTPDFKQFLKYVDEYFHVRLKHSKLLGFWNTELGALNEVVHIWEYDNHDHRAQVCKAIANDAVWQNDFISKISPMCVIQTNATMELLPWSSISLPRKSVYALWQHESFDNYIYGRLHSLGEADKSLVHNFHQDVLSGYCKGLLPHKVSPLQ